MNKQIIVLALVALVAGSVIANPVAENQQVDNVLEEMEIDEGFSQAAGDDGTPDETANMSEEQLYFRDYCLNAQGTIKNYVAEKLNGAAANIYSILLTSAQDIGREVLNAQKTQVDEGTKLITQAVEESNAGADAEEVEQTMQQAGIFARVSAAVRNVISAIIETAKATLFARINELKEKLGTEGLREKIEEACGSISNELHPRLTKQLTEAKASIKSAAQKDLTTVLSTARVDNIGCTLTSRISKVAKFCDILKVAGPAVYQLVGIN